MNIYDQNHENFFDELTRIKIVEYVLSTTRFVKDEEETEENKYSTIGRKKKGFRDNAFGLAKLLNLNVYADAYPIHDGGLEEQGERHMKCLDLKVKVLISLF